jgi:hypothetical protein
MSKFVLSFRSSNGQAADPSEEAAWGEWFASIGSSIVDPGNRVGETRPVGDCGTDTSISGYTLVTADDLDGAFALAKGCPGLRHGGGVEIGQIVDM